MRWQGGNMTLTLLVMVVVECSGLPDAPGVPSLPYLRGSDGDLIAAKAQGKAIIYCFWRASE